MNKKIIGIVYIIGIIFLILGFFTLYFLFLNFNAYLGYIRSNPIYLIIIIPWNFVIGVLVLILGILLSKEP